VIVVDSGVLIAAADSDDRHHRPCAELLNQHLTELIVPAGVVVEVCWILGRHVSIESEAAFLASIAAEELQIESLISVRVNLFETDCSWIQ
jgi:predicted nucleic acid-binding protein